MHEHSYGSNLWRHVFKNLPLVLKQNIAICNVPQTPVVGDDAEEADGGTHFPSSLVRPGGYGTLWNDWLWRRQHTCTSRDL